MYEVHFGLRERPFSLLPDPRYLFMGHKHSTGLAIMEYALLNQAGFCVLTGEVGSGKTTLVRHLLNLMDEKITVGLISNTHQSFGTLLQWILNAYGIECESREQADMHKAWLDFLIEQYAVGNRTLLIVDEAQNMDASTLEVLRVLSNINADQDQIFQVLLVGQPELREVLRRDDMRQFAQRIVVDYHLAELDENEIPEYIRHRLEFAGAQRKDLFTDGAMHRIALHSGGIPRLVNLLCDTALVYGYAREADAIDETIVSEVVGDKLGGHLVPIRSVRSGGQH